MTREEELAANLRDVRERIALACREAGRDSGEVTLIAVTKTFPASDVRLLAGLGVTDVGENRDQEAAPATWTPSPSPGSAAPRSGPSCRRHSRTPSPGG